jgi:hypothetical protein
MLLPQKRARTGGLNKNMAAGKPSICIDCKKSGGACDWSSKFKPIDGWKAKLVPQTSRKLASFCVYECPLFEKETERSPKMVSSIKRDAFFRQLVVGGNDDDKAGV